MRRINIKNPEVVIGDSCYHPCLKAGKVQGEKVCAACGRTIYFSTRKICSFC